MGTRGTATPQRPGVRGDGTGGGAPHAVPCALPGSHPGTTHTASLPWLWCRVGHGRSCCTTLPLPDSDNGASGIWHSMSLPCTARPCPQLHEWHGAGHGTSPHGCIPVAQRVPKRGMSPSLCPCFSNENKGSSHSPDWHPVPWQPDPSACPETLRDPQPQGQKGSRCHQLGSGLGAAELGRHEAAVSRHHMSRAALPQLRNKHPLSGRKSLEPALPPSPRRDPRLDRGRAGRAGGSATPPNGTARGFRQPTGSPGTLGCGWRGKRALPLPSTVPRAGPGGAAGAVPAPLSPAAGPPGRAGAAGGAGWAGTCRGRRGRRGSRGRRRRARPWPGARWGQRGAARGPQPHTGCEGRSGLSPRWVQ